VQTLERIDRGRIEDLLARDEFFWLDVRGPSDDELDGLGNLLGWHPLALEDAKEFHQRPKLDVYRTHALLVFYGVHEAALVEVQVFISGGWIVTVRHGGCAHLEQRRDEVADRTPDSEEEIVYRVLDALTDSFFPCVHEAQEALEHLEDEIITAPNESQLGSVLKLRRQVGPMARIADDQREIFANVRDVLDCLPGLETSEEAEASFGDISDHLRKIADHLQSLRERLIGALQLYSSMSDNRLNRVTERLTLVATVFLPLTFTVGFFGQNFGWLTSHVDGLGSFLLWGVLVGEVIPIALLYALFRRAGWLNRPVGSPRLHKRTEQD
jgi:magnesium transporter